MAPKMAPKRRERKPYHKQDLAEEILDPASHGVRVSFLYPIRARCAECCAHMQTVPRAEKEKKRKRGGDEEGNEVCRSGAVRRMM